MVGAKELLTCEKQTMSQSALTVVICQNTTTSFIILLLLVFVFCFVFKNCNHARHNSTRFEFIGVRECFRVINVHIKWIVCGLGRETTFMERV